MNRGKKWKEKLLNQGFNKFYVDDLIKVLTPWASWGKHTYYPNKYRSDGTFVFGFNQCFECHKKLTNQNRYWVHLILPEISYPCDKCHRVRSVHYKHFTHEVVCENHKPKRGYSMIISTRLENWVNSCMCWIEVSTREKLIKEAIFYFRKQSILPMEGAF